VSPVVGHGAKKESGGREMQVIATASNERLNTKSPDCRERYVWFNISILTAGEANNVSRAFRSHIECSMLDLLVP
jgi:hypothetical protein